MFQISLTIEVFLPILEAAHRTPDPEVTMCDHALKLHSWDQWIRGLSKSGGDKLRVRPAVKT